MSEMVRLECRGRSIEVDVDMLGSILRDADDRQEDRAEDVRRYPRDYDAEDLAVIASVLEVQAQLKDLIWGKGE